MYMNHDSIIKMVGFLTRIRNNGPSLTEIDRTIPPRRGWRGMCSGGEAMCDGNLHCSALLNNAFLAYMLPRTVRVYKSIVTP